MRFLWWVWWLGFVVLGTGTAGAQSGAEVVLPTSFAGARCGFVTDCTGFEALGLHLGSSGVLAVAQPGSEARSWALHGGLRASLTALDWLEVGAAASGRVLRGADGGLVRESLPLQLFARARALPLPVFGGSQPRLAVTYQHELALPHLGLGSGRSSGLLRLVASDVVGRLELTGSVGLQLGREEGTGIAPQQLELGGSASLWFWQRGQATEPGSELRLQAEALYRFPVATEPGRQGTVLLGLLGQTATGYGGGVAVGAQLWDRQPGLLVLARLGVSWGAAHDNPWATKKAGEPKTTPEWIWKLLGAIDPVVAADGCVWTDEESADWPAERWFCIGKPAPEDSRQIVLPDGRRVAAGTHVWELGKSLRLDDGSYLADIPLPARLLRAVRHRFWRGNSLTAHQQAEHKRQFCEGKTGVLAGAGDLGTAQMVANDPHGSQAALATEELMRAVLCSDMAFGPGDPRALAEAASQMSTLGSLGRRGPLRAKPLLPGRLLDEVAPPSVAKGSGGGKVQAGVAEHGGPPVVAVGSGPPVLSAKMRTHLFSGEVDKWGESKGWHHEASGAKSKGTYVIESTRSAPDDSGVYRANVIIEGVKKKKISTFFPQHWTEAQVEQAIAEAFANKQPVLTNPNAFRGISKSGVSVEFLIFKDGKMNAVYPVYKKP